MVEQVDVGLYDLQRRRLISLRDGEPVDAAEWPVSTALEHHGNHLGRLLVRSAAVEPAYETGGDIFEYSFDHDRLFLAVLDAMAHGLAASLLAPLATAALRRARREGKTLTDMLGHVAAAVRAQYAGSAYVSAVVVDIDLSTGRSEWFSAGHLPPAPADRGRSAGVDARTVPPAGYVDHR
ncbi:MAG: serine/threonine-protein phosphatase [Acidimicrobiia bacterium]|nr:serine/threonine-protein phosphatase [Acidimicrobiia bacterium]